MKRIVLITIPILLVCVFLCLLFCVPANAKELIPRPEFIKYTEAALDALDELEAAGTSGSKRDTRQAIIKVDAALKKYERYVKTWLECEQAHIVWQITKARLSFGAMTADMEDIKNSLEKIKTGWEWADKSKTIEELTAMDKILNDEVDVTHDLNSAIRARQNYEITQKQFLETQIAVTKRQLQLETDRLNAMRTSLKTGVAAAQEARDRFMKYRNEK